MILGDWSLRMTGSSELWKAKNIYDLAGNAGEWSMCVGSAYYRLVADDVTRTRSYRSSRCVADMWTTLDFNASYEDAGFRVALYVK